MPCGPRCHETQKPVSQRKRNGKRNRKQGTRELLLISGNWLRALEKEKGADAMIDLSALLRFPCDHDKRPLVTAWQHNAARRDHSRWPLVGVPTGAVNGFDVLDIDLGALGWRDENRDRFPLTQVHTTRSGGWHYLFRHSEGLRNSAGRIAPGVDVRADGGFVIWWAREGLPFTPAELGEWPEWLLELAVGQRRTQAPHKGTAAHHGDLHGDYHGQGTLDPHAREKSLLREVERAPIGMRNRILNWAAYQFGWMVAEGVRKREVVELVLCGAAQACGLWREDGAARCKATIKSGLDAGIAQAQRDAQGTDAPLRGASIRRPQRSRP